MLEDSDIIRAQLPARIRSLLFKNRFLDHNHRIAARLNLNAHVWKNNQKHHLLTIHDRKISGPAIGYDHELTLRDVQFVVNQKLREAIACGKQHKAPMAGLEGFLIEDRCEGVEVRFNPRTDHLFTTVDQGFAVRSAKRVTMRGNRCYADGIAYWSEIEAPMAQSHSQTRFQN